jgi:tRNA threonylcarbamoyladenosine biosynthesis protein TsaB
MGLILQMETSTEVCSVAISNNGKTISIQESMEPNCHTEKLTLLVKACMDDAGIDFQELSAVCISDGPGSYTSLRVGASVAKGICYATKLPLIAIDSLRILAQGFRMSNLLATDMIVAMIDARRMEVYASIFDGKMNILKPISPIVIDQDEFLPAEVMGPSACVYLCGSGAKKYYEYKKNGHLRLGHTATSADFMSAAAYESLCLKNYEDVAYFTPNYLKSPNITKSTKNIL